MTSENSSRIRDTKCRSASSAVNEPGSEQSMFIEKLRSAAHSATDRFSRAGDALKRPDEVKVAKSSAVQDILQGFSLHGADDTT
jgi:cation transport regulator ChaB